MNYSDKQKLKKKLQVREVDPRVREAIKSIVTSINSSIKEVYDSILEPYELLKEELRKSIYIHPELYKEIEECLLAEPEDEVFKVQDGTHEFELSDLKTKKDGREYFVLTHKCEHKTNGSIQYAVTKRVALWVSKYSDQDFSHQIEIDSRNRIIKAKGILFDDHKRTLFIEEYPIPLLKSKVTFLICKMLFSSKSSMKKLWYWEDIEEKVLDRENHLLDPVNAFNSAVSKFNKRVFDLTSNKYSEIIKFSYSEKTVRVNPEYVRLFE